MSKKPKLYHEVSTIYDEDRNPVRTREAYYLITPELTVEGWRMNSLSTSPYLPEYFGGVEMHSATPIYEGHEPMGSYCRFVPGGVCYHDGSSLAYDSIEHLFHIPSAMESVLGIWV